VQRLGAAEEVAQLSAAIDGALGRAGLGARLDRVPWPLAGVEVDTQVGRGRGRVGLVGLIDVRGDRVLENACVSLDVFNISAACLTKLLQLVCDLADAHPRLK
jgi:hypothetical protein